MFPTFSKAVRTVYLEIGAESIRLYDTSNELRQQLQSSLYEKTLSPHACDNNISMATVSGDVSTLMMMMMIIIMMMKHRSVKLH